MSETYPKKEPLRNAFRRTYSLQRRNRLQIFQLKVYGLKFIVKDLPE